MIYPKDLRPFKASELVIGGVFYLKEENGSFSMCKITEQDIKSNRVNQIRALTVKYAKEERLFVRINAPWKPFDL